jgi:hypothetical protein
MVRMTAGIKNVSDTDLGFVQVDSAVYEQDTRIGTFYHYFWGLAGFRARYYSIFMHFYRKLSLCLPTDTTA